MHGLANHAARKSKRSCVVTCVLPDAGGLPLISAAALLSETPATLLLRNEPLISPVGIGLAVSHAFQSSIVGAGRKGFAPREFRNACRVASDVRGPNAEYRFGTVPS